MRCPYCLAKLLARPAICPNCHKELTDGKVKLLTEADNWYKESYHVWILLGNLISTGIGWLLFRLGTAGIVEGLFLMGLAALSLVISRGGFRWDDLSRGQQVLICAGVLGPLILVGLVLFVILAMFLDPHGGRAFRWGMRRKAQSDQKPAESFFFPDRGLPTEGSD